MLTTNTVRRPLSCNDSHGGGPTLIIEPEKAIWMPEKEYKAIWILKRVCITLGREYLGDVVSRGREEE